MICFAWVGLTKYAARAIGAFVRSTDERVVVLATHSRMPYKNVEECAGCEVRWVTPRVQIDILKELGECPRVMFSSAWWAPEFSDSWSVVREHGGKVVGMIDNNFVPGLRTFINGLRFRFKYSRYFDGFLVPGNSGVRLLRSYGVPEGRIAKGMYCADSSLFKSTLPLSKRPKKILFTGQLIERKNVLRTCSAFLSANAQNGNEWTLEICGKGPLLDSIPKSDKIQIRGFVQPEELCSLYQSARCFILPSLEEHWGVVVHEAAISGCYLLLSDRVGASEDFLLESNGRGFNPFSEEEIFAAFNDMMKLSETQLDAAGALSAEIGMKSDQRLFVESITTFVKSPRP